MEGPEVLADSDSAYLGVKGLDQLGQMARIVRMALRHQGGSTSSGSTATSDCLITATKLPIVTEASEYLRRSTQHPIEVAC